MPDPPQTGYRLRRFVTALVMCMICLQAISCGTILHPERRGLRSDRLDPAIVALDGLGLLFFFVPGAIAFAVDFSTGAIYLPPDQFSDRIPDSLPMQSLTRIEVEPAKLTQARIESVIHERTGRIVDLESPHVRVIRLNDVDEVSPAIRNAHANEPTHSSSAW
jgi:hypothetical protein